ncbi:MAG: choice-of-anchor L domain-containing protein, partial [Mycobacteriales bacterium]
VMEVTVNGVNCATVPGTSTPVSINTINDHTNARYYVDNAAGAAGYNTTYDGLTVPLTCDVHVTPGQQVTVRIAVADASDYIYDSGVALLDKGIWSD